MLTWNIFKPKFKQQTSTTSNDKSTIQKTNSPNSPTQLQVLFSRYQQDLKKNWPIKNVTPCKF